MRPDLRIVLVASAAALVAGLIAAGETRARTTRPGAGTAAPASAKPATGAATGSAKPATAAAKPKTAAAKPATAAAKPKTAAVKPATAVAKPKTSPLKTASVAVAKLPPGTACKAYIRCIKAMALAFEAADFPGGKDAGAAMRSAIESMGSMGEGLAAEEACRTGLGAIGDAASDYAILPGFKLPMECSAPSATAVGPGPGPDPATGAVAPAPGALLLRARRARILPATPDGRYWDGRGVPSAAILEAVRALWAGTTDYYAAFVDADPVAPGRVDRPDPYVIVWLNGMRIGRSSPLADSLVPAWRDGPEVVVANPATDRLQFSVWDDDTPAPTPGSEPVGELIGDCTGTVPPHAAEDGIWVLRCAGGIFELEVNVREAR